MSFSYLLIFILLGLILLLSVGLLLLVRLLKEKQVALDGLREWLDLQEHQIYQLSDQMVAFTKALPDPGFILDRKGFLHAIFVDDPNKITRPDLLTKSPEALQKVNLKDLVADMDQLAELMTAIHQAIETGKIQTIEYPATVAGEDKIMEARVSRIDANRVIWLCRDITERIKLESQLARLSMFDENTGVANRKLLMDRMDMAICNAQRQDTFCALVIVDIDELKLLNDYNGTEIGDEVLKRVAGVLHSAIRETDTVARLGGDEFAVILTFLDSPESALNVLNEVLKQIKALNKGDWVNFAISVTMGLSFLKEDMTKTQWMKEADLALLEAKKQAKGHYHVFSDELSQYFDEEAYLLKHLKKAIAEKSFFMVYQPQFDVKGEKLVGMKALIRWQLKGEMISPGRFIPVAERHHLIAPISWMTLQWICEDINQWMEEGVCPPKVAFNLSPVVMKHERWDEKILSTLEKTGTPRSRIEIEITEGALVHDLESTQRKMQSLHEKGFHFSIDDFGTGYSSMKYLEVLPIEKLKVDQSFIKYIDSIPANLAIVRAIIILAHSLGMDAIAEGVETAEQQKQLTRLGCDQIQGYLFSKPLPVQQVKKLLCKLTQKKEDDRISSHPRLH